MRAVLHEGNLRRLFIKNEAGDTLVEVTFDANGDTSQLIISFYGYDPATKNWAFKSQLDFAKPAA